MKHQLPKKERERLDEYERKIEALMTKLQLNRRNTVAYILEKSKSGTDLSDILRSNDIS